MALVENILREFLRVNENQDTSNSLKYLWTRKAVLHLWSKYKRFPPFMIQIQMCSSLHKEWTLQFMQYAFTSLYSQELAEFLSRLQKAFYYWQPICFQEPYLQWPVFSLFVSFWSWEIACKIPHSMMLLDRNIQAHTESPTHPMVAAS